MKRKATNLETIMPKTMKDIRRWALIRLDYDNLNPDMTFEEFLVVNYHAPKKIK